MHATLPAQDYATPRVERRQHAAEPVKCPTSHFEAKCAAEWQEMRNTLILAEHRALNRRFTGDALTGFGAFA